MATLCSFASTFRGLFFVAVFFIAGTNVSRANLEGDQWIFHWNKKDYSFKRMGDHQGTPLICIDDVGKKLPIKIKFDPKEFSITFFHHKNHSKIWTHSTLVRGQLSVGGKELEYESNLSSKPVFLGARLCLPTEFGDRMLRPILESFPPDSLPVTDSSSTEAVDVVIDPGHGGNDLGAHRQISPAQNFREKDFVIQVAKELKTELGALGVRAKLTREADHFLTLPERSEIANNSRAKFFLSIHMNSAPNPKDHGYELYVLSLERGNEAGRRAVARENQFIPADLPSWLQKAIADLRAEANLEFSLQWAQSIDKSLKGVLKPSSKKHIQMGPFYLLYGSSMPAVLLELGYLTSEVDRKFILNPRNRAHLTKTLAKNIANQLKEPATQR